MIHSCSCYRYLQYGPNNLDQSRFAEPFQELEERAIKAAIQNGKNAVLALLNVGKVNPTALDSVLIQWASKEGENEIVSKLLQDPRVDPTAEDSVALLLASIHGHVDVVRTLLRDGRADPSANMGACVIWAHYHEHDSIVKLLLADNRVNPMKYGTFQEWVNNQVHSQIADSQF